MVRKDYSGVWCFDSIHTAARNLLCDPKQNEKNSVVLIIAFPSIYGSGILLAKTSEKMTLSFVHRYIKSFFFPSNYRSYHPLNKSSVINLINFCICCLTVCEIASGKHNLISCLHFWYILILHEKTFFS